MTVSFRLGRYLVALLWHWATPAAIGFAIGSVLATLQIVEVLKAADDQFYQALTKVVHQCAVTDPTADTEAEQVQGRAPGSSDHASPIRRTEARAERTLDPARTEKASARECGECFSPHAPEPSAARVG
ncbi:hypothetical protein JNA64_13830 [Pseudomonas stutzeri]|uniref:hypothetical protein n=1 Tax=Stutzerimonas stutzeri TaxID=316 RepID=UPI001F52427F|nr:hypothetical protein [Stutzerimonas stutzeri]MCI0918247.1 hypothetical protein [Stutzerimonas stutzeri]